MQVLSTRRKIDSLVPVILVAQPRDGMLMVRLGLCQPLRLRSFGVLAQAKHRWCHVDSRLRENDETNRSGTSPQSSSAAGFTLLELLITLGILAALAGLTLPSLWNPLEKSRLQGAARQVKAHLAKSRVTAIQGNEAHYLRCLSNDSRYQLEVKKTPPRQYRVLSEQSEIATPSGLTVSEPDSADQFDSSREDADSAHLTPSSVIREWALPDGIVFSEIILTGISPENTRRDSVAADAQSSAESDPNLYSNNDSQDIAADSTMQSTSALNESPTTHRWLTAIPFQPSGSTRDTVIRLKGTRGFGIEIRLRGLTGGITIGKPYRIEPQQLSLENTPTTNSELSAQSDRAVNRSSGATE